MRDGLEVKAGPNPKLNQSYKNWTVVIHSIILLRSLYLGTMGWRYLFMCKVNMWPSLTWLTDWLLSQVDRNLTNNSPRAQQIVHLWQTCTQHSWKEVSACTKLHAHKSIQTPLSSSPMFKVVSYFYAWKQIIFSTIRSGVDKFFQLRSCC